MKELTWKELQEAPGIVQFIHIASYSKTPIGMQIYEEAIRTYPDYFEEEVELRKKWDAVPQYVEDEYFKAMAKMRSHYMSKSPHSGKGLMFFIQNPDAFLESRNYDTAQRPAMIREAKEIHKEFLASFNIPFNTDFI